MCRHYRGRIAATTQRQGNNDEPGFTDEEVLTIYLFGLFKKRETVSDIHEYTEDHFSDWFPDLPSYQSYNRRLNRLSAVFSPLIEKALQQIDGEKARKTILRIADSMPIMMAKRPRASQAKVASKQIADVGYCSSKDTFYHGGKLHVVAKRRDDKLPVPKRIGLTPASENDLKALKRVLPTIENGILCGDKAYCDGPLKERLAEDQNLDLLTPVKKDKAQEALGPAPVWWTRKPAFRMLRRYAPIRDCLFMPSVDSPLQC